MPSTVHSFRTATGVTLGVEHFGDAAAPLENIDVARHALEQPWPAWRSRR